MITLKNSNGPAETSEFLASVVVEKLEAGEKVLLIVTGGSSVEVASLASKNIKNIPHGNLTIMLTDERYGELDHKDSNWHQLIEKGFRLPEAKLIPILTGDDRNTTTKKFAQNLQEELEKADYKVGLFGVGKDGHTAGILPESDATKAEGLAFDYTAPNFERITMTPLAIRSLDEAVIYMQGQEKWEVVKDLMEKNINIFEQPAQVLKEIPKVTLFSDYQEN